MTTRPEPINEIDLAAFVDEQLDAARRVEVETYLAAHPDEAARVMADLRVRDTLRLLASDRSPAPPEVVTLARRLRRALIRRRFLGLVPRTAAVIIGLSALTLSIDELAEQGGLGSAAEAAPRYVEEAAIAHRVALVRAAMRSQPEVTVFDQAEVHAATRIVLPELPSSWRVLDAQVFPSDDGPSVQVTVDRGDGKPMSLFAVRARTGAPARPAVTRAGREAVSYWQEGEVALALTGDEPEAELDRAAEDLADNTVG